MRDHGAEFEHYFAETLSHARAVVAKLFDHGEGLTREGAKCMRGIRIQIFSTSLTVQGEKWPAE